MTTEAFSLPGYRLKAMIGRGAMASVFAAEREADRRALALKVVDLDLAVGEDRQESLTRFRLEAALGRKLRHDGLVSVHDYGEVGDRAFLAMDLVDGEALSAAIAGGVPVPWEEAVLLTVALLRTLSYVHDQGIVHRDVKLANVMRVPDAPLPRIKLMDFGVARAGDSDLTHVGDLIGTPAFMAPEQLEGLAVDGRSDLFSAGVVLYALLTGQRPFRGSVASVMHQILYRDPEPVSAALPGLPGALDPVLAQALAKRPDDRFADAIAFAEALEGVLERHGGAEDDAADATIVMKRPAGTAPKAVATATGGNPLEALKAALLAIRNDGVDRKRVRSLLRAVASVRRRPAPAPEAACKHLREIAIRKLVDTAIAAAPMPGAAGTGRSGDFRMAVEAIGTVQQAILAWHPAMTGAAEIDRLGAAIMAGVNDFAARMMAQAREDEEPDLGGLTPDLMRLHALHFGLERVGADAHLAALQAVQTMLASQIMMQVNRIVRNHDADPDDPLARFGIASLLSRVEELIVLAEDLIGDGGAGVGTGLVLEFIGHTRALARATMAEVMDLADGDDLELFKGRLKQVGMIYLFAARLRSDPCKPALKELVVDLNRLVGALTGRLTDTLAGALDGAGDPAKAALVLRQLSAIHRLAGQIGWADLEQRVALTLRDKVKANAALRKRLG